MNDYIDARMLRNMFLAGTVYLERKKDLINELNVFPVPDGDTGTNMLLTLMSAVKELNALSEDATMDMAGNRISSGTLRGARGNSGVIMSQLCRGFLKSVEGNEQIGSRQVAEAMDSACAAAYKAVVQPKEGTILTVARETAQKALELTASGEIGLQELLNGIVNQAEDTLSHTPEMLPVLKEAGVVDSGGQGLLEFLCGARDAFSGTAVSEMDESGWMKMNPDGVSSMDPEREARSKYEHIAVDTSHIETADIRYTYCTEYIIELSAKEEFSEEAFREFLMSMGDSIVCVRMDSIVKVHVHTNHPGKVIEAGLGCGELSSLKIDNMKIEHHERVIRDSDREAEKKKIAQKTGFVAVCAGEGIRKVFESFHVDQVIEGGQTMNPSTQDIVKAIYDTKAEEIFVLPNNHNILLAARQAAQICSDRKVAVIPSSNICEGISAMVSYVPASSLEENLGIMTRACSMVKSGEVTVAIRDTALGDQSVHKGDYMGIGENRILSVSSDLEEAATELILSLTDEESSFVTIYYGEGQTAEDAEFILKRIEQALPDIEAEVTYGGQPVYYYIVSVE